MIIRQQAEQESAADQWDGTDIEPTYPSRKINQERDLAAHDEYIRKHREGDRFS